MTDEEKNLLLKDLCGRLWTNVFVQVDNIVQPQRLHWSFLSTGDGWKLPKPYLRPMESMTEEEKEYIKCRWCYCDWTDIYDFLNNYKIDAGDAYDFTDWLNRKMFDYRGLIPMGLAMEAPQDMYKNI